MALDAEVLQYPQRLAIAEFLALEESSLTVSTLFVLFLLLFLINHFLDLWLITVLVLLFLLFLALRVSDLLLFELLDVNLNGDTDGLRMFLDTFALH